jgi:hypothetical protein
MARELTLEVGGGSSVYSGPDLAMMFMTVGRGWCTVTGAAPFGEAGDGSRCCRTSSVMHKSVWQNDSPILRYVRELSELSRYAPDEVDTEEKRVKRFIKGLNPYMRMLLCLTGHHNFQGIVDIAITLEDDYKSVQEERRKKARTEPKRFPDRKPTPNLTFKPRPRPGNPNPNPHRGGPNPKNNVRFHNCGVEGHYKLEETTQSHMLWMWTAWTHETKLSE